MAVPHGYVSVIADFTPSSVDGDFPPNGMPVMKGELVKVSDWLYAVKDEPPSEGWIPVYAVERGADSHREQPSAEIR